MGRTSAADSLGVSQRNRGSIQRKREYGFHRSPPGFGWGVSAFSEEGLSCFGPGSGRG